MVHRVGVGVGAWLLLIGGAAALWACESDSTCDPSLKRLDGTRCGGAIAGAGRAGGTTSMPGGGQGGGRSGDGGDLGDAGEAGDGGASGEAGDTGFAGRADGDPPNETLPTRWLTFSESTGTYAYDVTKFPEPQTPVPLAEGAATDRLYDWSPDGRRMLYLHRTVLYSRDMSDVLPGPAVALATVTNPLESTPSKQKLSWSADSRSLALVNGDALSVFDPTDPAALLHTLTNTLKSYRWASVGKRLFYIDANGVHVLEITADVPSVPKLVDGVPWDSTANWSPDGAVLAGCKNGSFVAATFDDALEPTLQTLPAGNVENPSVSAIVFSRASQQMAFIGAQQRALPDLYVVSYESTLVSAPKRAHPELGGEQSVDFASFSEDGHWLVYRLVDAGSPEPYRAVNLASAEPGEPMTLAGLTDSRLSWLPGSAKFVGHTLGNDLAAFELPPSEPTPFPSSDPVSAFSINPRRPVLGYNTQLALHLRDLSQPAAPRADLPLLQLSSESISSFAWSPDGKLISVLEQSDQDRLGLMRVDGTTASSPFNVRESAPDTLSSSFQP